MTFAPFGNIDVDSIYKYLDIPKVPQIFDLETGKFVYKLQKDLLPNSNIANYFEYRNANVTHSYNLRPRKTAMRNISFNSVHGEKSIQCRGAKIWNEMPEEIRDSASLNIFKKHYKAFLMEYDHDDGSDFLYY